MSNQVSGNVTKFSPVPEGAGLGVGGRNRRVETGNCIHQN